MKLKKLVVKKLTEFMEYIADGDDGLMRELKKKGAVNIIKEAIYLTGAVSAILTLWVAL
jgi:hypothetical protein